MDRDRTVSDYRIYLLILVKFLFLYVPLLLMGLTISSSRPPVDGLHRELACDSLPFYGASYLTPTLCRGSVDTGSS